MSLLTRPIGLHHSVSQGGHILTTVDLIEPLYNP